MNYLFRRIAPFFLLFLSFETALRLTFLAQSKAHIENVATSLKAILIGVGIDITLFTYFLIPICFYLLLLPKRLHGTRVDKVLSSVLFFIYAYIMLFTSLSEWFFWDEFTSRFNFIAVDYLVYTHEVIGNIRESYPVTPLLIGIGVLGLILSGMYYKRFSYMNAPTLSTRFIALGLCGLLAFGQFSLLKTPEISQNQYVNEIAKNGIFELFSAYRRNELKFEQFYVTRDEQTLRPLLNAHLKLNPTTTDGVTKSIAPAGEERHYNIVLITVESLSAEFMGVFGNQENMTPYLDKLAEESLFFSNLYAIGTRTVYGLAGISLSLPPLPGNSIVRRPENEKLFTLGSVLNTKGYVSKFIYGGFGYFDNMNYFFEHNGYQIVDRTNLSKEEITFANIWGVADEDLFNRALKENDEAYSQGKPFFDMIMTTSNHRPYTYPEGKIDIPSHTGRAGGVKYTDYAIGKFIEDAKAKPWFNNTIFVIIADHTAGSGGKTELDPSKYHIPLIIYAPHLIKAQKIDTLSSQIDLAPTLLALMNMHYESKFYGHDILNAKEERAFISNYQKIAYLTKDKLVIFKPGKQASFYKKDGTEFVADKTFDEVLLNDALSYFQHADKWKSWNKEIPAKADS